MRIPDKQPKQFDHYLDSNRMYGLICVNTITCESTHSASTKLPTCDKGGVGVSMHRAVKLLRCKDVIIALKTTVRLTQVTQLEKNL